ncbi:MAG TPA: TetR family transcriptional regulator [Pseudoclavibacter sp.]|nr:TetR family transcriptional regulator [Pseudoclavibacter sp.]
MRRIPVEQRRAELIAAAIRVIAREGIHAATTRAISAEAGMPLASFHYVFSSRDQLLREVIEEVTGIEHAQAEAGVVGYLAVPPSPEADGLADVIGLALTSYVDSLVADPGREQAMLELSLSSLRNPALSALPREQYGVYYRAVEASIRNWADIAEVEWDVPAEQLSRIIVVVLDGITTGWLATRDTDGMYATVPHFSRFLASFALPRRRPVVGAHPIPSLRKENHAH